MSQVRFISDPHFGHHNMAVKRGFSSSSEMDEFIIKMWNSEVLKKDTVWILGDITMEKGDYSILNRLNGIKRVVLGNHDKANHAFRMQPYVNSIAGAVKYKNYWLTHMPIHPSELKGFRNIHGHIHQNIIDDSRYINVCCDYIGYIPIPFSVIEHTK
jgi:calcineurin-like phosphoesterase family protein